MSNTEPAPFNGDTFTLPTGFVQHMKYFAKSILGVAWMGGTFGIITFIICVIVMFNSEIDNWINLAWSTTLFMSMVGMALSTTILTIIVAVEQIRGKIEKGFTAWIKEFADLSITQHTILFMGTIAIFAIFGG